jgi:hypothetical protein
MAIFLMVGANSPPLTAWISITETTHHALVLRAFSFPLYSGTLDRDGWMATT